MAVRRLSEDEVKQIVQMRQSGVARKDIATQFDVPLSRIKTVLLENGVVIDKQIAQKNAYSSKISKNPNAMQEMRAKIDIEFRTSQIKSAYENEELRSLKKKQTEEWWKGLSLEDRGKYLKDRKCAQFSSEKAQRYFSRTGIDGADPSTSFSIRVQERGGTVLGQYISSKERVLVKCHQGHEFDCMPNSLQQGNWCPVCVHHVSKGQLEIYEYVKSIVDCEVALGDRSLISPKELDIYIPSMKLAIEYHGLYWHSSAIDHYRRTASFEKWQKCKDLGVQLLTIFEDEWYYKTELVKDMISVKLGVAKLKKLNARDLQVVEVSQEDAFRFFEDNHMSGSVGHKTALGLKNEGVLVSCASFRTNFNKEFEIARFATLRGVVVRGALGKILSKCPEKEVVSYSDNRFSMGQIYEKLGFSEITRKGPTNSYYYTDGSSRFWRFMCRKDSKCDGTEEEQALNGATSKRLFGLERPLYRVDDAGHRKWVKKTT